MTYLVVVVALCVLLLGWLVVIGKSAYTLLRAFYAQTMLLAGYVAIALWDSPMGGFFVALAVAILIATLLGVFRLLLVKLLLHSALGERSRQPIWKHGVRLLWHEEFPDPRVRLEWLGYGRSPVAPVWLVLGCLALTALSYGLTSLLPWPESSVAVIRDPLAVGLCLVVLGMFSMTVHNDLLAQSVGLILVENGLYLGGVALISQSSQSALVLLFLATATAYVALMLWTLGALLRLVHERIKTLNMEHLRELQR